MSANSFGLGVDRNLVKYGFKAGLPLLSLNLVNFRRVASAPVAQVGARHSARPIIARSEWGDYIPKPKGYRQFAADAFSQLPDIVKAGQSVYKRHEERVRGLERFNKPYFFNVLTPEDLRDNDVLLDFALSVPATEAVTAYLGHIPRLHAMGIFYSPVTDGISGSQMFHVDGDALAQVKCFVNIWDVRTEGGAFTFLSKQQTSRSFRRGGLLKTLSDADVSRMVPEEQHVVAEGPPGSGVFVDTSQCMHQGSRTKKNARLVFMFQYVSRPDTLLPPTKRAADGTQLLVTRQLVEQFKLSNPDALRFVG